MGGDSIALSIALSLALPIHRDRDRDRDRYRDMRQIPIEKQKQKQDKNNKTCGECTLCCRLMGVPEINKPPGRDCQFCSTPSGCGIYVNRPISCREFECFYLKLFDDDVPPDPSLRPDRCGVVLHSGKSATLCMVDPDRPNAWKTEPVISLLGELASAGFDVVIRQLPADREL